MKYIFIILLAFTTKLFGQNFQVTLKPGAVANAFKIVMRPTANLNNGQLSAYQLTILLPSSITPRPALSVRTNPITGIVPIQNTSVETLSDGSYYVYQFDAVGTATVPVVNYVAATEYDILEVAFTGGPITPAATVRAGQIPNGGSAGTAPGAYNNYLEINGTDRTNTSAMFYGSGASNSAAGYGGYSYVTIGNISLPTKFLSFFATRNDDVANLTWTVDNEENNAYFEVERSLDGRNFSKAYQVQALQNGRTSNSYTTPDANISRLGVKTIYYRIKQVENSGRIIYSEIRQVSLNDKNFSASLYPNPVKTSTKLVIDAPEAGKATVVIRDAAGKTVKTISLQLVKGINQQPLDATLFAAGDYNVTIVSEKLNQTIKMTKAN